MVAKSSDGGPSFERVAEKKAMDRQNLSFKKRKECIKKKTRELSILCGVKACVVIVDPDGKLETWPENSRDVLELFQSYRKSDPKQRKTRTPVVEAETDNNSGAAINRDEDQLPSEPAGVPENQPPLKRRRSADEQEEIELDSRLDEDENNYKWQSAQEEQFNSEPSKSSDWIYFEDVQDQSSSGHHVQQREPVFYQFF